MELSLDLIEEVLDRARLVLGDDVRIDPGYSGRAQYGRTCLALCCDSIVDVLRFTAAMALVEPDVVLEMVAETRMDQMGRGVVAYWPGWNLDDESVLELAESAGEE